LQLGIKDCNEYCCPTIDNTATVIPIVGNSAICSILIATPYAATESVPPYNRTK